MSDIRRPNITAEMLARRTPRPPDELVGALQDRPYPTGTLIAVQAIYPDRSALAAEVVRIADPLTWPAPEPEQVVDPGLNGEMWWHDCPECEWDSGSYSHGYKDSPNGMRAYRRHWHREHEMKNWSA